jgi:hypothetical protein
MHEKKPHQNIDLIYLSSNPILLQNNMGEQVGN